MRSFGANAVIVATAVGIACALILVGVVLDHSWAATWRLFGVRALALPFADTHGVTDAAACARQGIDVYAIADCDPFHRPYNYPPIWLLLGWLGVDGSSTLWFGAACVIAFICAVLRLHRGLPLSAGLMAALAVLSPATLLCIERGNTDLLMFALLVAFAALIAKNRWIGTTLAACVAGLTIILKLYPVFAISVFARFSRSTALIACGGIVVTVFYLVALGDTLGLIVRNTPNPVLEAFGAQMIFNAFALPGSVLFTVICIAGAALIAMSVNRATVPALPLLEGFQGFAFIVGAGVYCGVFLIFVSYAYRLIFLIMCLPQIHDWITTEHADRTRRFGWLLYGAILMLMWQSTFPAFLLMPHVASWVLFVGLAAVLFLSFLRTGVAPLLARRTVAAG